jgi:hypothetical protein
VSKEARVALWFAMVAAFLFGLAAYGIKRQVDECEGMKCKPPLRARLIRSTHYTNECLCVEVPQ